MTSRSSASNATFSSTKPARILIVDDHPIVREGLSALLCAQPDLTVCCEAATMTEAVQLVVEQAPDVAVVDIALKNENGLDVVRRIKSVDSSVRVLVVSMYEDGLYAERALVAGAMGYLNKQVASRNIVAAIRCVLAGQRYLSEEMESTMLTRQAEGVPAVPGLVTGIASLSDRELDVFRMIGQGLSTAQIASKLFLSVKTVESHRLKIKAKLGLTTSAELGREAAHFVLQNG